ncbi:MULTISPECIES: hypothetical protein [unclassified Streptomyces]|uniref:hypothetical protein n=1 Tax=unclassified Streptomyces TaxID=2593676 RepID=UPI00225B0414|nr:MULTISPECIES: hypothetical protein [unclassified Streptomyces]MCX4406126.1 hypothetical protein [Streptomyces sp. NBC_01764]MCX5189350.1 hypothetical protein [Streptomyces sp. NBC_00268]
MQDTAPADGAADEAAEPKKNWWQRRREVRHLQGTFDAYPHLLALKPKEKYLFRSDYFEVDGSVACILAYFHDDAAHENFAAFWGIDRIPDGLDERVTAVVLEQVKRMDEKWIDSYTKQSEKLDRLDANEQEETGTTSSKRKAAKISGDLGITIGEIQDGASYLSVHNRLFLRAPDLATLDDTIDRVTRLYIDRFGTLKAAPYAGEQRQELSGLWKNNEKKKGKGFHFTSTELAGSYSLVTNGLNDKGGEYVGYMVGDVNNSAVLMDVNAYDHHAIVADATLSEYLDRQRVANMWCSKISQAALLNNGQVVHLILDGANLDKLGPKFERLTSCVDLNQGDVNMFEMFGEEEDELTVFSAQMEKLKLMFEQLYETSDGAIGSIIRSALEDTATDFYVEQGMWRHNAKEQRHRLRAVNIPHTQVPRLQMFVSYLATAHKALLNSSKTDPDQLRAYNVLRGIANAMLSTNGDLFNNHTASAVDGVRDSRRVVYDFSRLMRRGKGVAMAQLVNIVGFAVGKLGLGDTLIIHGTEHIDDRVKKYIKDQFDHMYERGGRVVYSYNDVDTMLADSDFNKFDAADYTLFGPMRDGTVAEYQKQLHQRIPPDLAQLITTKGENLTYLRRGVSNVVFHLDLALGINPYREAQRRQVRMEAARAEEAARMEAIMHDKPAPGANLTSIRKHSEGGDDEPDVGQNDGGKRRDGKKSLQQPEDGARWPARKPKPKKLVKA